MKKIYKVNIYGVYKNDPLNETKEFDSELKAYEYIKEEFNMYIEGDENMEYDSDNKITMYDYEDDFTQLNAYIKDMGVYGQIANINIPYSDNGVFSINFELNIKTMKATCNTCGNKGAQNESNK